MWVPQARRSLAATIAALAVGSAAAAADFEAGVRAYEMGDYERAMQEWLPLAEAGDPGAQSNVAVLYVRGLGVDPDFGRAFHW